MPLRLNSLRRRAKWKVPPFSSSSPARLVSLCAIVIKSIIRPSNTGSPPAVSVNSSRSLPHMDFGHVDTVREPVYVPAKFGMFGVNFTANVNFRLGVKLHYSERIG